MILYNVTVNVDESIHEAWVEWMKKKHIPDVIATRLPKEHRFYRLLTSFDGDTGFTYSVQYFFITLTDYEIYRDVYAPALQQDAKDIFGENFTVFRTLLQEV